jgi:hypothetical protein
MTDQEREREGAEEPIEDLEAPAEAQQDVAGGGMACHPAGTCGSPSAVCEPSRGSCIMTSAECRLDSRKIVIGYQ